MKFIEFLKGVKQELFKITWLSKKEALISSGIVVAVSIIFALVFTLFDFVIFNTVQFILSIGK
ncbi:MAG: preprotein translocase subunit SecE [Rickettsiales bacterium]|nr:preprotein translocase subunit SecE [Rickettsiales bacterium]